MLKEILAVDLYKLFTVFARLGAAMMIMPAIGSAMFLARARLLLALALSFLMLPVLANTIPPMPKGTMDLLILLAGEVTVGLFFGLLLQVLMVPLDLAGNFISYSAGLTNAFTFDANVQQQSQVLSSFLSMVGVTMVLVTDTHHLMIQGLFGTYDVFRPGQGLPLDDFSATFLRTLGSSFRLGLELAAPLVVFSLAFNTALGLTNRLVPQMQVFFVGMPLQILGGVFLLGICLVPIMMWFLRHLDEALGAFIGAR